MEVFIFCEQGFLSVKKTEQDRHRLKNALSDQWLMTTRHRFKVVNPIPGIISFLPS